MTLALIGINHKTAPIELRERVAISREDLPETTRALAAQPGVILLPEHLFDSIERPRLFIDQMHMNGPGCALFSRILGKQVSQTLDAL